MYICMPFAHVHSSNVLNIMGDRFLMVGLGTPVKNSEEGNIVCQAFWATFLIWLHMDVSVNYFLISSLFT